MFTFIRLSDAAKAFTQIWIAIAIVFGIIYAMSKPFLAPYLTLPDTIESIQKSVATLAATQKLNDPQLLSFAGVPQVLNPNKEVITSGKLSLLYFLRRNVSCDTELRVLFYNVGEGAYYRGSTYLTVKAPLTKEFLPFKVNVTVPDDLPSGKYVYIPTLVPLECGVYKPFKAPPTELFEVTK